MASGAAGTSWVPPKNGAAVLEPRSGPRWLPLRQTEGFLDSLLRLMGLNLKATLAPEPNRCGAAPGSYDGDRIDSTGLKILGCGEWNAHKHKGKRRDWRKLHRTHSQQPGRRLHTPCSSRHNRGSQRVSPQTEPTTQVSLRSTQRGRYRERLIVIPPRRSASAGPTDGPWAQRVGS